MKNIKMIKEILFFGAMAIMAMGLGYFVYEGGFVVSQTSEVRPQTVNVPTIAYIEREDTKPVVYSQDEWDAIEDAFESGYDAPYVDYEGPADEPVSVIPETLPEVAPESEVKANLPSPEPFVLPDGSKPKIAIIIDDMGMNRKNGFELVGMDYPLTFAFLPYAPKLSEMTEVAQQNGHELMIHMPMEAMSSDQSLGGIALRGSMGAEDLKGQLYQAFASFEGYVGMNNHMGSRLTQDPAAMQVVMDALKDKDLYFVDSKTIGSSVAGRVAWASGLRMAERDVFLDHEDNIDFVRNALRKVENAAKQKGYAIAIGHPKSPTIQGLKEWLPTLEAKGFEVVKASALVRRAEGGVISAPKEDEVEMINPLDILETSRAADPLVINPAPLNGFRVHSDLAPDLSSIPLPE